MFLGQGELECKGGPLHEQAHDDVGESFDHVAERVRYTYEKGPIRRIILTPKGKASVSAIGYRCVNSKLF